MPWEHTSWPDTIKFVAILAVAVPFHFLVVLPAEFVWRAVKAMLSMFTEGKP